MSKQTDKRKFIASSEIFSDFSVEISLYNIESIDEAFDFDARIKEVQSDRVSATIIDDINNRNRTM